MQFCDACGSMMRREGEAMVCTNDDCGERDTLDADRAADFVSTEAQSDEGVIETSEDSLDEGKPKTDDVRCDNCGNEEAWYTLKQTASADEPPTRFFKCTECGHRWRGYN